jgi:hypothetical protein
MKAAFIVALVVAGVAALLLMAGAAMPEPTCEERGGKRVSDGSYLQPMVAGKITILMPMPKYRCEGARP